jgi:two-component system chemotaxis response regulator CheY
MQVIVVDDDAVSRLALVDLMQKMGFTDLLEFEDGQAAWEYLQKNPLPILCCCDVRMPKMSGIELLQKVRGDKNIKALSFVLITSGHDRDTVQNAVMLGVSEYIVKPFNAGEAIDKLNEIFSNEWKKISERPEATARRLSIPKEKLENYYHAFNAQVEKLINMSAFTSDVLKLPDIDGQIDAMITGCLTLGLWHCSRQLEVLKTREDKGDCLEQYLSAVESTVNYQLGIISSQKV